MFLSFITFQLFNKFRTVKPHYSPLTRKLIITGFLFQLASLAAYADHQECTQVAIPSYDPSSSYDALTETITVTATPRTIYTQVCYMVPDIQDNGGTGGTSGGGTPARPQMPKPPYCATLDLDLATCLRDAQVAYSRGVQDCSSSTWYGGVLGVIGGAIATYYTGGSIIIIAGSGGVGGATTGNFFTSDCQSDWQSERDNRDASCNVDFQSRKLTCAQFK